MAGNLVLAVTILLVGRWLANRIGTVWEESTTQLANLVLRLIMHSVMVLITGFLLTWIPFSPLVRWLVPGNIVIQLVVWWIPFPVWRIGLTGLLSAVLCLILANSIPPLVPEGPWAGLFWNARSRLIVENVMLMVDAIILCVSTGGHIVQAVTSSLLPQTEAKPQSDARPQINALLQKDAKGTARSIAESESLKGLPRAGRLIGWLERAIVFLLILIDQAAGIGFLVAAKSILRFGDLRDSHQRVMTEYVIIGTFLSIGWAILMTSLLQLLLLKRAQLTF